ncbi:18318_t:CDS:2, partial [Racocetra persica]
ILMDEVFNTIFHKKKMRQALQSPSHQAALIDRLIDKITAEQATIDSLDKAIAILKLIKSAYNGMDEVSSNYNKGYQKPGETNCETRQSKVLTIDPDFLDDLEIFFLAD